MFQVLLNECIYCGLMLSSLLKLKFYVISFGCYAKVLHNITSDYYVFLLSAYMLFNLMEIILLHLICVLNENVSLLKQITSETCIGCLVVSRKVKQALPTDKKTNY